MKNRGKGPKKDLVDDLKDIGEKIENHFKKGMHKVEEKVEMGIHRVEEIFKNDKKADDKLFSYFKVFLDDKGVASVTPSSKYIVKRVLRALDLKGAKVVIEYGAADGVITRQVLDQLPKDAKLLAIELNEQLYEGLKEIRDPRLIPVNGDVREVVAIARKFGIEKADRVFSGIPFAFLSGRDRHELLNATYNILEPNGRFIAYQVTTHLIGMLEEYFRKVKTEFEIRNIPPHFVFTAFK